MSAPGWTGCPCGCAGPDDPACIRHRPLRVVEYGRYDVEALGLVPHDRESCTPCQLVGE